MIICSGNFDHLRRSCKCQSCVDHIISCRQEVPGWWRLFTHLLDEKTRGISDAVAMEERTSMHYQQILRIYSRILCLKRCFTKSIIIISHIGLFIQRTLRISLWQAGVFPVHMLAWADHGLCIQQVKWGLLSATRHRYAGNTIQAHGEFI